MRYGFIQKKIQNRGIGVNLIGINNYADMYAL